MSGDPLRDAAELVPRVYAYVAYRIGAGPDAEDVTAAVFERAVRYRDSWDRDRGEPVAWLVGIARRCIDDHRREVPARLAAASAAGALEPAWVDAPEVEERLDVRAAVAALPPRDRELVALRYGADLSTRRIAALLGLTPAATRVALHRALERLRERLAAPEAPPVPPLRAALRTTEDAT